METVERLAKDLDLRERELVAVCRLAGVPAAKGTDLLTSEQVLLVRDVLAGRVVPKPPKVRRQVPTGKAILVAAAAIVAVGLAGLLLSVINQPARVTVLPGDCFDEPDLLGARLDPVPCGGAHKYRAFARLELNVRFGAEYPGLDLLEQHVPSRCQALHDGSGQSDLFGGMQIAYFYPDEVAWERGARAAICATFD